MPDIFLRDEDIVMKKILLFSQYLYSAVREINNGAKRQNLGYVT